MKHVTEVSFSNSDCTVYVMFMIRDLFMIKNLCGFRSSSTNPSPVMYVFVVYV